MATMNEKIRVEVELETSKATSELKQFESGLKAVGQNNLGGTAAGTNALGAAMEELKETLNQIRSIDAFDLMLEHVGKIENQVIDITGGMQELREISDQFGADMRMIGAHIGESFKESDLAQSLSAPFAIARGKIIGAMMPIKKVLIATALAGTIQFNALQMSFQRFKNNLSPVGHALLGVFTAPFAAAKSLLLTIGSLISAVKALIASIMATPLGILLAAIVAITALASAIKGVINRAKELTQVYNDAAKIGMATQEYQKWGYVLESVGVEADEVRDIIKGLSDTQAELAEGAEGVSKSYEALGLSVEDVLGMNQEELFTETIKGLQNIEDGVKRTQIAYQIFGEDAAHVANVINMSNSDFDKLIENYYLLGGSASQNLIDKSRTLSNATSNLGQAWKGLTNTLSELFMPMITAIVNGLTKVIVLINSFLKALFGLKSANASTSTGATSGMSSYEKATNSATKAVQKLKREAMGFDELNKLPGQDTSSGGSGAGDGGYDFGGGNLGSAWELPDATDLNLESWKKAGETLAKYIVPIIALIGAVWAAFSGNLPLAAGLLGVAGVSLLLIKYKDGAFDPLIQSVKDTTKKIISNVVEFFTNLGNKIIEIKDYVFNKAIEIKDWLIGKAVEIKDGLIGKITEIREGIGLKIEEIKLKIAEKLNGIKDWWNKNMAKYFTKQYWLDKFESIKNGLSDKLNAIKNAFSTAWTNIKNTFSGWGTFFTNLWEKVKSIFKSVGTSVGNTVAGAVKSVINSILNTVESKINSFITMINNAIGIINKIPGVNITKLSKISIPRLATGGIVNSSTIANIGEAGAEAVLPLENNTQWMDLLADKIAARNSGPSKIVLSVDGKELGWASIHGINNITDQTGSLQLRLV